MIQRIGLLLLMAPLGSLALVVSAPSAPEANAQDSGQRREEGEEGGRGEGRGRGRGRFRGGENGEGGGEFGGRRGFMRRGGESRGTESSSGDRSERSGGPPSSSRSERPSCSSASGSNLSMDDYVRSVVKQHDKNGDMMLQADEQKGLSSKAATADLDKDGVITTNELTTTLSGNATASAPGSTSASGSTGDRERSSGDSSESSERGRRGEGKRGRDRGENEQARTGSAGAAGAAATRVYTALPAKGKSEKGAANETAAAKRTYRFTRGADRLPTTGLPSWFKSRDANSDGQVAMNEYSRSWSDRTVGEFRRYDLDNDGVITAKEAASK
jgi:hypothetical protein